MIAYQCNQAGSYKQQGFSLFEMVLIVLLIGVLMSIAFDRLLQLEITTEEVQVQHVIGALSGAAHLQAAELVLKKGLESVKQLDNSNPMDYLAELPHNYAGVKTGLAANQVPEASWYFDAENRVLVYKVRYTEFFESNITGEPRIELKLGLVYRDDNRNRGNSNIQGVKLRSLYEYNWRLPG